MFSYIRSDKRFANTPRINFLALGGRLDIIRHLKRALTAGDVTVLHDVCEYDSRLEAVLKKSVKKTEGRENQLYKILRPWW